MHHWIIHQFTLFINHIDDLYVPIVRDNNAFKGFQEQGISLFWRTWA